MAADVAVAAADKRCRWRKDKKEPAEAEAAHVAAQRRLLPGAGSENLAASHAFRGLHGNRSNFGLVSAAVDDVYQTVLGGNAFYYQALVCPAEDFSMFEALVKELDYVPCWMQGGMPLHRPTALGSAEALRKSPTYDRIVRWLANYFKVEPIRSLVNYYRDGDDYTSPHSDQYFSGVNMTIGASFGEERGLSFEHRASGEQFSFPQHNGDIFAFTEQVNRQFSHSVPKRRQRARSTGYRHSPGRVSVIVWARRQEDTWKLPQSSQVNLLPCPHVLEEDPALRAASEEVAAEQPPSVAQLGVPSGHGDAAADTTASQGLADADAAAVAAAPPPARSAAAAVGGTADCPEVAPAARPSGSWRRSRRQEQPQDA